MLEFHDDEYNKKVMTTVRLIRDVLNETDFDVATNALMAMLAQIGKQSTLDTEDFLSVVVLQIKHLMDYTFITKHTVQ